MVRSDSAVGISYLVLAASYKSLQLQCRFARNQIRANLRYSGFAVTNLFWSTREYSKNAWQKKPCLPHVYECACLLHVYSTFKHMVNLRINILCNREGVALDEGTSRCNYEFLLRLYFGVLASTRKMHGRRNPVYPTFMSVPAFHMSIPPLNTW
jgi:hypothetical protein